MECRFDPPTMAPLGSASRSGTLPLPVVMLLALLLTACGRPEPVAEPEADDASGGAIGAPLHRDLERAEGVESLESAHKADMDAAIDRDSGSGDADGQ